MKRKIVSVILLSALVLSGCKNAVSTDSVPSEDSETVTEPAVSSTTTQATETTEEEGYPDNLTIDILNATDAPDGVYFKTLECSLSGENGIKATQEQMEYIVSFVDSIEVPSYAKDIDKSDGCYSELSDIHTYLGRLKISFYSVKSDGDSRYKVIERHLFDEYPEGFDEFIKLINELDGNEPIILGEPLTVTSDLVKNVMGYTDDMVADGTIEDVLSKYPVDSYHLMNAYYNDAYLLVNTEVHMEEIFWYWPMFRVLPTEIKNVQSTEEEYQAYVEAVAKAFGADPSEITDFRLGGKFIPSQNVIVYQSCDIYEALEYSDTIPYHLVLHEYLDGGELDKNERYQIFYSPDGKFVIAINGSLEKSYFSDCIAAFELYEYYQKISDLVG